MTKEYIIAQSSLKAQTEIHNSWRQNEKHPDRARQILICPNQSPQICIVLRTFSLSPDYKNKQFSSFQMFLLLGNF